MAKDLKSLANDLMHSRLEDLTDRERKVLERLIARRRISRNVNSEMDEQSSAGDRLADKVAQFGGSWTFIILFGCVLFVWIGGNALAVRTGFAALDPYPFIFLNLILSMLAAVQAPIIMMSQNRQSEKDRAAANNDYDVNLKAELEIMQLHEKLDEVRLRQLTELIAQQSEQIDMLRAILTAQGRAPPSGAA